MDETTNDGKICGCSGEDAPDSQPVGKEITDDTEEGKVGEAESPEVQTGTDGTKHTE